MLLSGSITDIINGFLSLSFAISWKNHLFHIHYIGGTILHSLTELEINLQGELSFNLRCFES